MDNTDIRSYMGIVRQKEKCFQDPRVFYRTESPREFFEHLDNFNVNDPIIISGTACDVGWKEGLRGTITKMTDVFVLEHGEVSQEICNTERGYLKVEVELPNGKTRELRFNYSCILSIEEDTEA